MALAAEKSAAHKKRAVIASAGGVLLLGALLALLPPTRVGSKTTGFLSRTPGLPTAASVFLVPPDRSDGGTEPSAGPAPAVASPPQRTAALPIPLWGNGGAITLTFDDYGTPVRVNAILDLLAQYHVRAIFFPIGLWANAHPDLIARMLREGHLVGNHTYDHAYLPRLRAGQIRDEIARGYQSTLFRPPYGAYNPLVASIAAQLGYQVVLWTIDTRDWAGVSASSIVATVLGRARPGAIVLMHMHGAHTLEALPEIIQRLQAAGYVLSTAAALPGAAVTVGSPTPSPSASATLTPTPLVSPTLTSTPASPPTASPSPIAATPTARKALVTPVPTETLTRVPRP